MVAVVGGKAERQLGEVARADHDAALLVGEIHQDLRALTRLAVFIGHVVRFGVLSDVAEVDVHRVLDVDVREGRAERGGQRLRVGFGALRRAEAGHRHGVDVGHGAARNFAGAHRDQQGEAGVEAAGKPDHERLCAGGLHAAGKPARLNFEDAVAAVVLLAVVRRDEGMLVHKAGQHRLGKPARGERDADIAAVGKGGEGVHLHALHHELFAVDLACRKAVGRKGRGFGQQTAVFGDEVVRREDQVGRGFALARVGVNIGAERAGAARRDQHPAVGVLADQLVRGGEVGDDGRARGGMAQRRRRGHPQILADLDGEREGGDFVHGKELLCAEQHVKAAERHRDVLSEGGREMAALVEFAVVGDVAFRHEAEQPAVRDHGGAVVEAVAVDNGQADERQHMQAARGFDHAGKRRFGVGEQLGLEEQVGAGVAGEKQLGQDEQLCARRVGAVHRGDHGLGILHRRAERHARTVRRDLDKSVFHSGFLCIKIQAPLCKGVSCTRHKSVSRS